MTSSKSKHLPRPHLQLSSQWELGLQRVDLGEAQAQASPPDSWSISGRWVSQCMNTSSADATTEFLFTPLSTGSHAARSHRGLEASKGSGYFVVVQSLAQRGQRTVWKDS